MKIYRPPHHHKDAPQPADPLIICAREVHLVEVFAAACSIMTFVRLRSPDSRRIVHEAIKKYRALLAAPVPAPNPIIRLEEWQLVWRIENLQEMESAEFARRLRLMEAMSKALSPYDPRGMRAKSLLDDLRREAARRFLGLFAPVVLDLAA